MKIKSILSKSEIKSFSENVSTIFHWQLLRKRLHDVGLAVILYLCDVRRFTKFITLSAEFANKN